MWLRIYNVINKEKFKKFAGQESKMTTPWGHGDVRP